jgi:cbb3-type cytochrome oxidase subunit 3
MENKEENFSTSTWLALLFLVFICGIIISSMYNAHQKVKRKYRISKSMIIDDSYTIFNKPNLIKKFIVKDTTLVTYEHITIVDKCVQKDTLIKHITPLPSSFIAVGATRGKPRFFCLSKDEFNTIKIGEQIDWRAVEIENPINCK